MTRRTASRRTPPPRPGVEYYLYQLSQDNDYWTQVRRPARPRTRASRTRSHQRWMKSGADTRTGHWRKVPGSNAEYAIELMPEAGHQVCVANDGGTSMLDRNTGHVPGPLHRPDQRADHAQHRRDAAPQVVPRLPVLHELRDARPRRLQHPGHARLGVRATARRCATTGPSDCEDITFRSDDAINGPFHTNDDILTCGGTTLGRTKADSIEISGPHAPGWKNKSGCSGSPNMKGTLQSGAEPLEIPPTSTNSELAVGALPAYTLHRQDVIELDGTSMGSRRTARRASTTVAHALQRRHLRQQRRLQRHR